MTVIFLAGAFMHVPFWSAHSAIQVEFSSRKMVELIGLTPTNQIRPVTGLGLENLQERKPCFFPPNIGLSCRFSLKPIQPTRFHLTPWSEDADFTCSAANVQRTCATFGKQCVGLAKYPNATVAEYGDWVR